MHLKFQFSPYGRGHVCPKLFFLSLFYISFFFLYDSFLLPPTDSHVQLLLSFLSFPSSLAHWTKPLHFEHKHKAEATISFNNCPKNSAPIRDLKNKKQERPYVLSFSWKATEHEATFGITEALKLLDHNNVPKFLICLREIIE